MTKKISIEVFRDIETAEVDPQIAIAGIDLINKLTDSSLEIVNTTRKMRISKAGSQTVRAAGVRWSPSPLDIRVILTSRKLEVSDDHQTFGYSSIYTVGGGGVAVVSTFGKGAMSADSTTAHELSHLFKLRYESDDEAHCPDLDCIMHAELITQSQTKRIQKRGIQAWKERRGYQVAEYTTIETAANDSFCDPCKHQLAKRAFFMTARKNGVYMPEYL